MIKLQKRMVALIILVTVLATTLVLGCGLYIYISAEDVTVVSSSNYQTMRAITEKYGKLYAIQKTVEDNTIWKTDQDKEMDAMYHALVSSLGDKYSQYMNKEEVKQWNSYLSGEFSGIGIQFYQTNDHRYVITKIISESPAASSNLKEGDYILEVDGKNYSDVEKMRNAMRGDAGTQVKITYERNGKKRNVTLTRGAVKEPSVYSAELKGNIGYIAITAFEKDTSKEFKTELAAMEKRKVKGLIIDIRNNGGGYAEEGVKIADMLLPECAITYMKDNKGKKKYYNSDENCTKLKYDVIVNENTASTAEILASSIKDNKGGKLIGTTTFGKGIVQGTYDLKDGTALKLTIMQYFSPKGNKIHKVGVKPDYPVALSQTSKTDKQLERAISLLQ